MKELFMTVAFLAAFLVGNFVCRNASAQDLGFQEYRKFLMSGDQTSKKKMAIQTTCTTATGEVYRIGEKNYDTCLAAVKNQADQKQMAGANGASSSAPAASATTTIHIGN